MLRVPALALLLHTWTEGVLVPPVNEERFFVTVVIQVVLLNNKLKIDFAYITMDLKEIDDKGI